MNDNVIVSCIIPVYNTEKYIERTIDSLRNQTWKDFEIIFIDDASKDNSAKIIEDYIIRDSRIKLKRSLYNLGAAECRNIGLKLASGKYVMFLDSDDFFYENMLELAVNEMEKTDAELLVFNYRELQVNENDEVIQKTDIRITNYIDKKNYSKIELIKNINPAPWNKMYRRDFLVAEKIKFQIIQNCNDVYFMGAVLLKVSKIVFLDKILVDYFFERSGSLSKGEKKGKRYIIQACNKFFKFCIEERLEDEFIKELSMFYLMRIIQELEMVEGVKQTVAFICDSFFSSELYTYLKNLESSGGCAYILSLALKNFREKKVYTLIDYYRMIFGKIYEDNQKNNKKIALWGCGKIGKALLGKLQESESKIDYVIDQNPELQHKYYADYEIFPYDEIKDEVDVIIVTNGRFTKEIKALARGKEVIFLPEYG